MSCDFKPGDEVVCVDDTPRDPRCLPLRKGHTYTVTEVFVWFGVVGVNLAGVDPDDAIGFWADRFRKVERRTDKQSLTEWLKQPSGDTDHLDKTVPAKKRERVQ